MKTMLLTALMVIGLSGCDNKEPENYGGIPKETLDKVAKDAEDAAEEAQKKLEDALKNIE
ncbi:MAG: hypothetical protein AAF387_10330 [Pseudomonadota bacterium]